MKSTLFVQLAALATATALMPIAATGFVDDAPKAAVASADDNARRFERVRPILARCAACHNDEDASGGLDLSTHDAAMEGGTSGAAIQPGDAKASRVHRMIASGKMPPKTKLSAAESDAVQDWIDHGAFWPPIEPLRPAPADDSRWALRPLATHGIPEIRDSTSIHNSIDAFVLAKLEQGGLKPAPTASRRTLIRRASFDLIGLPPSPEEIESFLKDPRSDRDAFAALIDRLLASPHYGERWGRHWLDLARFGESQGFERDKIRDHAWRYRDYVIQAFNADKPYGDFIKEQIAGDLLQPSRSDAIIASSFLVCGPWDEVGASQVSALMRARVREEELEEMIGLVSQTFLGLTVNCARCHDHKFDPIPQRDFYRLEAGLASVRPGDRSILAADDEKRRQDRQASLRKRVEQLRSRALTLEAAGRERARRNLLKEGTADRSPSSTPPVKPWLRWDFETGVQDREQRLGAKLVGQARLDNGQLHLEGEKAYLESEPLPADLREKTLEAWISLANLDQRGGGALSVQSRDGSTFDAIVYGEEQPRKWMAGSEGFQRTQARDAALETASTQEWVHMAIVYRGDGRIHLYRNGIPYGEGYSSSGPQRFERGKAQALIGLRHFGGRGAQFQGAIEEARIYDRALTPQQIAASYQTGCGQVPRAQALAALSAEEQAEIKVIEAEAAKLNEELGAAAPLVYGVTPKPPAAPVKVLGRGDPEKAGETVTPGGLSAIKSVEADFGLEPNAPDHAARFKLAEYLADPAHPLTARVLVNRVWLHHFGAGLVGTPNDFGANGERPTHPELLDHLAQIFLEGGRKLKPLHKRIMLSAAYMQSSRWDQRSAEVDADARLLWRYPPQRLEGEAIRDAMLVASGDLNLQMGGPGFRPFNITIFNAHLYTPTDPIGPDFNRRTIYRTQVNSGRSPFLDLLDCPDPSVKTPKRAVTTTPLQALALMNDSFVLRQSQRLAARVAREAGDDPAQRLERAFALVLGRAPESKELDRLIPLAQKHGMQTACWALFNSNEFLQRP